MNLYHQFLHYCIYPWIMILCLNLYLSAPLVIPPKKDLMLRLHPIKPTSKNYSHDELFSNSTSFSQKSYRYKKEGVKSDYLPTKHIQDQNGYQGNGSGPIVNDKRGAKNGSDIFTNLNERNGITKRRQNSSKSVVEINNKGLLTTMSPAESSSPSTYQPYTLPFSSTTRYKSTVQISDPEHSLQNRPPKSKESTSGQENQVAKSSLHNALYPFVPDLGKAASPLFLHFAGQALHHITKRSISKGHNRKNRRRSPPLVNSASESSSLSAPSLSGDTSTDLNDYMQNRGRECETNPESSSRMFTCPSLDINGRYVCIEESQLCNKEYNCPLGEDEDGVACLFRKTMLLHIKQLIDVFMEINRV